MSTEPAIRRELEIEAGSEPISGRITAAGQRPRGFVGWFELFAAIEELRLGDSAAQPVAGESSP
jgi:hypothetical protein